MSFEELLNTLEEKAKVEETAILNAAKIEARKIQSEANSWAKNIIEEAKSEGQKTGSEAKAEINANALLKQKRIIAQAREELVGKTMQETKEQLRDFTKTNEYEKTLAFLARDCVKSLGKDCQLQCRKADEKKLKTVGFNVNATIDITGGVVGQTPDKRIKVNNSLEALFELHGEKLKQIAFHELFSEKELQENKIEKMSKEEKKEKKTNEDKTKKNSKRRK